VIVLREREKYINVCEKGSEDRMLRLVGVKEVMKCGMESVYKYYMTGKKAVGRVHGIRSIMSILKEEIVEVEKERDRTISEQLIYVLPSEYLKEMGIIKEEEKEIEYDWTFKDYFWEADVIFNSEK